MFDDAGNLRCIPRGGLRVGRRGLAVADDREIGLACQKLQYWSGGLPYKNVDNGGEVVLRVVADYSTA